MKINLAYPKIPILTNEFPTTHCYIQEKYDGTNLHFVYDSKRFTHFGTRRDRYPLTTAGIEEFAKNHKLNPQLHYAPILFQQISSQFDQLHTNAIVFTEFLGNNSFNGKHQSNDPKYFVIIDVMINKDFISPSTLYENFKTTPIIKTPTLLFQGKFNGYIIQTIQNSTTIKEGAVIKAFYNNKVIMAKIKTNQINI